MSHLREFGLYNSLYDYFDRIGCWWCPKQPLKSLRSLYRHFPHLWAQLLELEEIHGIAFKHGYPAADLTVRFQAELDIEKRRPACLMIRNWNRSRSNPGRSMTLPEK